MSCRIGKTRQRGLKKSAEELRMGMPALRQYIDATMPVAPIGNGVQICSVYNFQISFRGFFFVRRTSPNDAGWFGASIGKACYKEEKNRDLTAAFCLFGRPVPIHFALLGRKWKYIKSKTTAKLTEKRTSLAAVRDILWTFGTFPTHLLSHYRLPLKGRL
jgi:hypothetical protein